MTGLVKSFFRLSVAPAVPPLEPAELFSAEADVDPVNRANKNGFMLVTSK